MIFISNESLFILFSLMHIQCFLKNLLFQVNQEKICLTSIILKVVLALESKRNNTGSKWPYFTPNLSLLIYVNASFLSHLINHTYRYLVSRSYFLINLISNELAQRNSFLFIFNFINLFCLVWIIINLNDNFTLLVYKHFFLAPIKSFNSFIQ